MINIQICSRAKKKADKGAWGYLVGGAEDELCLRRNRKAFQQWSFLPQGLYDVSRLDLSVEFLGIPMPMPVIAAPVGGLSLFHERGDLEWAKGLSASQAAGVVSGVARVEFEKIIEETTAPLFYQLYFFGNDEWVKRQLQLAEKCGYQAIVVTYDTKYYGQRERDLIAGFDARNSGWRTASLPPDRDRNLTLNIEELRKIKTYTKLPLIIKGIMSEIELKQVLELGVDAVWISNHGGRQLDHISSSLDALVKLAPLCRRKCVPVIFDGGVRRGAEVVMAYLLGADLVAIGRLPVYGLIVDGAKGVEVVFRNLREEVANTMGLLGLTHLRVGNLEERKNRITSESIFGLKTIWDELEARENDIHG